MNHNISFQVNRQYCHLVCFHYYRRPTTRALPCNEWQKPDEQIRLWEMPSSFLTGFLECRHRPSCGTEWTHILAGGAAGRFRFESTDQWRMLILQPHNSECNNILTWSSDKLVTRLDTGASDNSSGLTDPPKLVDGRYFSRLKQEVGGIDDWEVDTAGC